MLDKFVSALNKLNHNSTIFLLFVLGVVTAAVAFYMVVKLPGAPVGIAVGFGGLGAVIVGGAMMAFRGPHKEDDSQDPPAPAA